MAGGKFLVKGHPKDLILQTHPYMHGAILHHSLESLPSENQNSKDNVLGYFLLLCNDLKLVSEIKG